MEAKKRVVSTNFTPEEIFAIFVEQHRLCSPLDPMADENFVLTLETTIIDWRDAQDLLDWEELALYLNQQFRIAISLDEWRQYFEPEDKKTISGICQVIASHAVKCKVEVKPLLGSACLTASVFLDLKERLSFKGVDVANLRPSSEISPYLEKYFSPMLEEITQTGVRVFDRIEATRKGGIIVKLSSGNVVTFRDVINQICVAEKLSHK